MEIKFCNKCKRDLPFSDFYKSKKGKFGLQAKCKSCFKEYETKNKERIKAYREQWRKANKDKISEYNAEYQMVNREELSEKKKIYYQETLPIRKAYQKKQYRSNREEMIERSRKWYHENKDRKLAYDRVWAKEWRAKNKDKTAIYCNRRRALKKKLPSTLSETQWKSIKNHFKNTCAYCGNEMPLEQEHFIPVSKGGEYTHNNIIPACRACNASKSDKDFFEWYPSYEHYSMQREQKILSFLNYNKNKQQQLALL